MPEQNEEQRIALWEAIRGRVDYLRPEALKLAREYARRADEKAVVEGALSAEIADDFFEKLEELADRKQHEERVKEAPELLPDTGVAELAALSQLLPEVRRFRDWFLAHVSGGEEPPFTSTEEAATWIEGHARRDHKRLDEPKFWKRYCDLDEAHGKAEEDLRQFLDLAQNPRHLDTLVLSYYRADTDEDPAELTIPYGVEASTLSDLKRFAQEASERTGFDEAEFVSLVLTGRRPKLRRILVSEERRGPVSEISVRIRAPNPTERDLRSAYDHLKRKWELQKNKSVFKKADYALLEAKESLDEREFATLKDFWQAVHADLERRGQSSSPEAVYRRWRRMLVKNPHLGELEPSSFHYPAEDPP